MDLIHPVIVKHLPVSEYQDIWQAMKAFTDERDKNTCDEIWLVQHPPVFTLGQAGKPEHILNAHGISIVNSDRGGQVTYHGPGQIVAYLLLDIKRLGIGARGLVTAIEQSIIELLKDYQIDAFAKKDAPGVYVSTSTLEQVSTDVQSDAKNQKSGVKDAKIAALGLRIRKACSYHGLSLNVDMDLTPYSYINPCGYEGQAVTQLIDLITEKKIANIKFENVEQKLIDKLCAQLNLEKIVNT